MQKISVFMKFSYIKSIPRSILITFAICMAVAFLTHGFGMFHYPYYEGDEGIYTSQAWSLVKEGSLSPYVYWYDHPPFGWITMAAWTIIFGGNFFVFGDSSIDNMRVFMLLVHVVSAGLVFFIARRLSNRTTVAAVATLLFTLSPLFIFYQRRVLIDNVMTMWILLSYALLLSRDLTTRRIILSGVFFAFALLTKIPAIVFLPAFMYTLWLSDWPKAKISQPTKKDHAKRFMVWLFAVFCIGMVFIGYTLAKGEFFPPSVTGKEHVSFISGIQFQLSRDSEEFFWERESYFRGAVSDWLFNDRFSVIILTIGILIGFVASWKNIVLRSLMAFIALYLVFLMRGSIVTNFYILPLVPFAAIATAMSFWWLTEQFIDHKKQWKTYIGLFSVLAVIFAFVSSKKPYTVDDTTNYKQAIIWIKENIDQTKNVMADVQGLVDLWDEDFINDKSFRQSADWFSKVLNDAVTRDDKLGNDYKNIDYILSSHELLRQMKNVQDDRIGKQAFLSSAPIKDWTAAAGHLEEASYSSGIGNWAKLYQIDRQEALKVEHAWRTYKKDYIHSYGQIIDPEGELTTSVGQGYGMLRAVFAHDRATYDGLWQWTRDHFQHRNDDKLLSSEWKDGSQKLSDNNTFADATIAASLVLASQQWGDPQANIPYREQAIQMISDIWRQNVVTVNGVHYMLATDKASDIHTESYYIINPTFLTPVWYELFAQFDDQNPWSDLAQNSYQILSTHTVRDGEVIFPGALELNRETGQLSAHSEGQDESAQKMSLFEGDPYKTIWFATLDVEWFESVQATQFIRAINGQDLSDKATKDNIAQNNATALLPAYIAYMTVFDQDKVQEIYEQNLHNLYDQQRKAWGQSDTYYSANWMWLTAALYQGLIVKP